MKGRCERETDYAYKWYGARGISVCDEWKNSFESFSEWALNNGYEEGLSIDRIDVNGNYEPSNCRWATQKVQANNTRASVYYEYNGEQLTVSQISEKTGLPKGPIKYRVRKGVPVMEAVKQVSRLKEEGKVGREHQSNRKSKSSPKTQRI